MSYFNKSQLVNAAIEAGLRNALKEQCAKQFDYNKIEYLVDLIKLAKNQKFGLNFHPQHEILFVTDDTINALWKIDGILVNAKDVAGFNEIIDRLVRKFLPTTLKLDRDTNAATLYIVDSMMLTKEEVEELERKFQVSKF